MAGVVAAFVVGFFSGREYLKYEIARALAEGLADLSAEFEDEFGSEDLGSVPEPTASARSAVSATSGQAEPARTPQPAGRGVTLKFVSCKLNRDIGIGEAEFTLSTTVPYEFVGIDGEVTSADGKTVFGSGSTIVSNVEPGKTYNESILYSLTGTPGPKAKCTFRVDSAR